VTEGEALELTSDLRAFPGYRVEEHLVLTDDDTGAPNTTEGTARMQLERTPGAEVMEGQLRAVLLSLSWNVLRLNREAEIA
jgi:alpha-N-arabinofuranosidase